MHMGCPQPKMVLRSISSLSESGSSGLEQLTSVFCCRWGQVHITTGVLPLT
jgi:hypothetical protein